MSPGRFLDPALGEGPRTPTETVRPLVSDERVLLLNGSFPAMVEVGSGRMAPWENGPPVLLPCVSRPFDLFDFERIQVQVLRDPRPTSVDLTLVSLTVGSPGEGVSIEIRESVSGRLEVLGGDELVDCPIGSSQAVVVVFEPSEAESGATLTVSARNADTMQHITTTCGVPKVDSRLLVGSAPPTPATLPGRARLSPVLVDVSRRQSPPDLVKRGAARAKRYASAVAQRVQSR